MGCFVSVACCVRWEAKSFGGDKEEALDEEDDDVVEELEDEQDVEEDVPESESSSSESEGGVDFRFRDGNTVESRTDRPGIGNEGLRDLLRFRWRVMLDSHTIWV